MCVSVTATTFPNYSICSIAFGTPRTPSRHTKGSESEDRCWKVKLAVRLKQKETLPRSDRPALGLHRVSLGTNLVTLVETSPYGLQQTQISTRLLQPTQGRCCATLTGSGTSSSMDKLKQAQEKMIIKGCIFFPESHFSEIQDRQKLKETSQMTDFGFVCLTSD